MEAAGLPEGSELYRANAELGQLNRMVMQQSNGRFAAYAINRGTGYHGYDTYARIGNKSHATVAEAAAAARARK